MEMVPPSSFINLVRVEGLEPSPDWLQNSFWGYRVLPFRHTRLLFGADGGIRTHKRGSVLNYYFFRLVTPRRQRIGGERGIRTHLLKVHYDSFYQTSFTD
jgi:hypothetical protein